MKKIIKKGKTIFQTKCIRCECEFTYDLDDLKRDTYIGFMGVYCPECDCKVPHSTRTSEVLKEYE